MTMSAATSSRFHRGCFTMTAATNPIITITVDPATTDATPLPWEQAPAQGRAKGDKKTRKQARAARRKNRHK
jgi:hypothetical protein